MSELKSALERLADRVSPPGDSLERLSRRRARAQRNRQIGAAALAIVVAAAGVGAALAALSGSREGRRSAAERHTGYYVDIPDRPDGYDKKDLAILDAETNLPDGTIVDLYLFSADVETPTQSEVKDGRIAIRIWNGFCHETEQGLEGTTTKATVIVSPVSGQVPSGGRGGGHSTPPPRQPPRVQAVLGPNFENLTGDQVREDNGNRVLVASKLIQLPAETCVKKFAYAMPGDPEWVPVDQPISLPPGPFPRPPFESCPDPAGALPVEAGDWATTGDVGRAFDAAITAGDTATLRRLADPSVKSFEGWTATGSDLTTWTNVPSGAPAVLTGCGALVALRTVGVTVSSMDNADASVTYLLILREDGWKVWGQVLGDGR